METEDITLIYKKALNLDINQGIIMDCDNQSIAIIKRKDNRGIYYSINDIINNLPQKPCHDECAMTLLLLNKERFVHHVYKSRLNIFQ